MYSEWSGEVLIPSANITGYRLVYEAETWLRRICLAALMLAEGPAWSTKLDPVLYTRLEAIYKKNSSYWYLGIDAEEELLWSTTHHQLAELLQLESVLPKVVELTGMRGTILADRLKSIRAGPECPCTQSCYI